MKKILVALSGLLIPLSLLFAVNIITAPAANAACVIRSEVLPMSNATVGGTTHDMKGTFKYQACGSYADILEVSYQIYPGNNDCGWVADEQGGYRSIDEYRFNVNAIGGWDPAMKAWNCENGRNSYVIFKDAPGGTRVHPGDPASARCIAANVTIVVKSDFNVTRQSASNCVNFN